MHICNMSEQYVSYRFENCDRNESCREELAPTSANVQ